MLFDLRGSGQSVGSSSRSVTPVETPGLRKAALTVSVGEQLETNYEVHELPVASNSECNPPSLSSGVENKPTDSTDYVDNAGLLKLLKAENRSLKSTTVFQHFRVEQVHNDKLFQFYTGFISCVVFFAFYEFLGPVVNELNYWGSKTHSHKQHSTCKLDPINQLFLTLVKLRLNLKVQDLVLRFGLSTGSVSVGSPNTCMGLTISGLKQLS